MTHECLTKCLGGTLGFYCQHAYAHANDSDIQRLPFCLKGVDAIFYSVFHHLGLTVGMRAVMEELEDDEDMDQYDNSDDEQTGAELVSTGLHGIQLDDHGGDDGSSSVAEVKL